MMKNEAQRRATARWDADNMRIVACKLRREIAVDFMAIAARHGTNANALIRGWVLDYIRAHEGETLSGPEQSGGV